MHYDPTKKSKKRSCYLGYAARLATITLNDERFCKYKDVIRVMDTNIYKNLDKDVKEDTLCGILNLLVDMGWPKKFVLEKLFADIYNSTLSRLWRKKDEELGNSAFIEKRKSSVDFSRYVDTLDQILFDVFRSDGFRNLKEGLELN